MAESEKAKLYREIVQQTTEQVLMQRMRLYGFWPQNQPLPQDPPQETAERTRLETEMANLRKTASLVKNPQKALAEERKRRWLESKKRRAENKAKRAEERKKRREAYDAFRKEHVVHVGADVSGGLQHTTSATLALTNRGLPVLQDSNDVAAAMGITLGVLRWLTYHRRAAAVVHYHRFDIAKKTGGLRSISAPKAALARAQRWVFDNILMRLEVEPQVHGFVPGHSILSNATPHVGKQVVVNLDVKDFFPSVTFRRVKGLFQAFGYSEHVATVFALLCTEPPRVAAEVDGKVYHVALSERVLPQGACTSPAITNALCRRLDRRLAALAKRHGYSYTRYADDLTFSGDNGKAVGRLLRSVRAIVLAEGFTEHPRKTRVMRRANRQEVTGVTVNTRPTVSRKEVRTLRAILHNAARDGLEKQNRTNHPNFAAYLRGRVEFVCMVDPKQAEVLRPALAQALAKP
ncbi:MAG TPA: reverse transcriptase domain-containing protein [Gemmataceae bacterium]|nr:reverse transcriptase domain-containing protein [Gemmataceae bacterium]